MKYSFKKGAKKGLVALIPMVIALVTFAGFSDLTIWGLMEKYIKPIVGGATITSVLTVVLNWAKVRAKIKAKKQKEELQSK